MIRKLAFLAGAGFLAKALMDRRRGADTASTPRMPATGEDDVGHVPTDLLGDAHPDGSARAEEHYRPDPTAPVSDEDREGLRPVTAPAPHDPPGR